MGEMAAASLLSRLNKNGQKHPHVIYVDPELVVRGTTARVKI